MTDSFATRLAWARTKAGISARALDKLSGLTPGHVSAIENGTKSDVASSTAAALSGTLGVSLDWLISGRGPDPKVETIRKAVTKAA